MKELFLLRGLPGSGKSTLAKRLNHNYIEADHYFLDGLVYKFDASKLKEAHQWCKDQVEGAMKNEIRQLTVSNTFTMEWEMQPYFDLAEKYGYRVYSLICENRHGGVNEHGVPQEKIEQMRNRFTFKL